MRNLCVAAIAAGLTFAPAAWAQPLAAGKPAGVRAAQYYEDNMPLIILGIAAAIAVIAVTASDNGHHDHDGGGGTVVPPTTT
jgi:hypothetical protein